MIPKKLTQLEIDNLVFNYKLAVSVKDAFIKYLYPCIRKHRVRKMAKYKIYMKRKLKSPRR